MILLCQLVWCVYIYVYIGLYYAVQVDTYFRKNINTWKQINGNLILLYQRGVTTEEESDKISYEDPPSFAGLLAGFLQQKVLEYKNNEDMLLKYVFALKID